MKFDVSRGSKALCGIWSEKGMEKAAEQLSIYLKKITGASFQTLDVREGKRFEIIFDGNVNNFAYYIENDIFVISAPDAVKVNKSVKNGQ